MAEAIDNLSSEFPAIWDEKYPIHRTAHLLEPYLKHLVQTFKPLKVILFGSQACGQPTEHSDYDLLVIRSDMKSERDSNIEIRLSFLDVDAPSIPFTILSKSPERIAERLKVQSPFYEEIILKGLTVYDSANPNR